MHAYNNGAAHGASSLLTCPCPLCVTVRQALAWVAVNMAGYLNAGAANAATIREEQAKRGSEASYGMCLHCNKPLPKPANRFGTKPKVHKECRNARAAKRIRAMRAAKRNTAGRSVNRVAKHMARMGRAR